MDVQALRQSAVAYLEAFEKSSWHSDCVCSLVRGEQRTAGQVVDTVDAFGEKNGWQVLATGSEVEEVLNHVRQLRPERDLRKQIREVEKRMGRGDRQDIEIEILVKSCS